MTSPPTMHLVLVEPEIPWNTGNVGRSCVALGAHLHLIEPLGFEIDDRRVRRAGLDYWPKLRWSRWPNWNKFVQAICPEVDTEADRDPTGAAPRNAAWQRLWFFSAESAIDFWDSPLELDPAPPILVFGCETRGLPESIRDTWTERERLVRLPMTPDSVRSINLSTAVALGGWEVRRRRST